MAAAASPAAPDACDALVEAGILLAQQGDARKRSSSSWRPSRCARVRRSAPGTRGVAVSRRGLGGREPTGGARPGSRPRRCPRLAASGRQPLPGRGCGGRAPRLEPPVRTADRPDPHRWSDAHPLLRRGRPARSAARAASHAARPSVRRAGAWPRLPAQSDFRLSLRPLPDGDRPGERDLAGAPPRVRRSVGRWERRAQGSHRSARSPSMWRAPPGTGSCGPPGGDGGGNDRASRWRWRFRRPEAGPGSGAWMASGNGRPMRRGRFRIRRHDPRGGEPGGAPTHGALLLGLARTGSPPRDRCGPGRVGRPGQPISPAREASRHDGRATVWRWESQAATWMSLENSAPFGAGGLSLDWCSSGLERCDAWQGRLGISSATSHAPLALWSGAGTGYGRAPLLRAHPLLDGGVVRGPRLRAHARPRDDRETGVAMDTGAPAARLGPLRRRGQAMDYRAGRPESRGRWMAERASGCGVWA